MKQYTCEELAEIIKGNNSDAKVLITPQIDPNGQIFRLMLTISGNSVDLAKEIRSVLIHAMPGGGIETANDSQLSTITERFYDLSGNFFFSMTRTQNEIVGSTFCFFILRGELAQGLLDYAKRKDRNLLFPRDVESFFRDKGVRAEFRRDVPYGEKLQAGVIQISGRETDVKRLESCLAQTIGTKDQSVPMRQGDPRYYSSLHGHSPSELKFAVMGDHITIWGQIILFNDKVVEQFLSLVKEHKLQIQGVSRNS